MGERNAAPGPAGDTQLALVRSFGRGIRELREARSWSQEQLADLAILNRSYVGEIERGEVTASLATIAELARAFKVAPSALVQHGENTLITFQHPGTVWWR
ncbi:helix-turn-helix domain-containing protein [Massilia dura]|uniref:Helix-turn-helix domain-containing protein n=1 Tax=Pseudoduganella dura TaxID=321982 RepID=A0A6I3XG86_9BURK|nr:helix-turn-helix transcriptional regulator [Pseudoduganella dura]MUI15477.1 helix-turn-helix domain-containing protein [Pseudoduganella dura]